MSRKLSTFGALAALVALSATPLASEAGASKTALDACVNSFVDTYLPDRTVHRVVVPTTIRPHTLYTARDYSVHLTAHGSKSGELVAEAFCIANRNGIVVVLESPVVAQHKARADYVVSMR